MLLVPTKQIEQLSPRLRAIYLTNFLAIERWANYLLPAAFELRESLPGAVSVTTFARYYPQVPTKLRHVLLSAQTAASGSSVLTIYKNGSSVATVTLAASSNLKDALGKVDGLDISYNPPDYFHSALTTVGAGLAGVGIQQIFSAD